VFRKVLVANRGEIAIRAFRAAYELGVATVAVFPYEDRNSLHRAKADESYQIGQAGHPVRAYLSVDEVVKAARRAGADAVYPGYGFLSENPDLAEACASAGVTFVGPPASVVRPRDLPSMRLQRCSGTSVAITDDPATAVGASFPKQTKGGLRCNWPAMIHRFLKSTMSLQTRDSSSPRHTK